MTHTDDAIVVTIHGLELPIQPPFTNRELHLIKKIAGVRAGELAEALDNGDNDVLVALAHIGIRRAGRLQPTLDELWEMDATAINIDVPADEPADDDETADPTPAGAAAAANGNGSPATPPSEPGVPSTATSST